MQVGISGDRTPAVLTWAAHALRRLPPGTTLDLLHIQVLLQRMDPRPSQGLSCEATCGVVVLAGLRSAAMDTLYDT